MKEKTKKENKADEKDAKEKAEKVAAEKKKKSEEKAHKARQAERDGKARAKEQKGKEVSSKAASKEAADKKKAKEEKARAKEKSDKKKAKEAADKNARERRGKNTCTLKAYEHNDYKGRTLSTHSICESKKSFKLPRTGRRRGYEASSFKLSSGCRQVQLWDEDACKENYKDNVTLNPLSSPSSGTSTTISAVLRCGPTATAGAKHCTKEHLENAMHQVCTCI